MNASDQPVTFRPALCVFFGIAPFLSPAAAAAQELEPPTAVVTPVPAADADEDEDEEEEDDEKAQPGQQGAAVRRGRIVAGADGAVPQKGFSLRKEDRKVLDKLADFRRHSEKKAWEQAFRAINELTEMNLQ